MTTEDTTKAILSRVEESVKELHHDTRQIIATLALKADMVGLQALEGRVRMLETSEAEDRGGRRYRTSAPAWISIVLAAAALGVSIVLAVNILT
jgi:hypothetical protein